MKPVRDIAWLAGILEGEGCFGFYDCAKIQVNMTDRDVIQRVADMFGTKLLGPYPTKGKPNYYASCSGKTAAGWMMTVYPFLGERRRQRIRETLEIWKEQPRYPSDKTHCKRGHPLNIAKKYRGRRVCRTCRNILQNQRRAEARANDPS